MREAIPAPMRSAAQKHVNAMIVHAFRKRRRSECLPTLVFVNAEEALGFA
jgi:hypothetical protein